MLQGGSSKVIQHLIDAEADVDQPYLQPRLSLVGIVHKVRAATGPTGAAELLQVVR